MRIRPAWSIFPAFYRDLTPAQLAELLRLVGLDTLNAVVRDGYWVDPNNLAGTLPPFVQAMAAEGVTVTRASTSYGARQLVENPGILADLRSGGITEFRLGWFPRPAQGMRAALASARQDLEDLVRVCEANDIKAVYQVHHDKLIQSPTAAYAIVLGLPSRWIGVELDPGNQSFEGFENAEYSVDLIGEYLCWFALKDTKTWQRMPRSEEAGKGWVREFCPVFEGVTDWQQQLRALARQSFQGTFVMMPFYDPHDPLTRTTHLKKEVEYLKALADTS